MSAFGGGKCPELVENAIIYLMGSQPFYVKGPHMLWIGLWAICGNVAVCGICTSLNYCVIFIVCTLLYGHEPHNVTLWDTGWRPMMYMVMLQSTEQTLLRMLSEDGDGKFYNILLILPPSVHVTTISKLKQSLHGKLFASRGHFNGSLT
jgi:hypothetical protein